MTNDFRNVQELLNTGIGTEGSLLIERRIYATLVNEVLKRLIPRDCAAFVVGPDGIPGSSLDVDLINPNTGAVRATAEGTAFWQDNNTYTSSNVKPLKYGVLVRITRELLEDGKWNLLESQIGIFGRRIAENENTLVIAQLDTAANTVSAGAIVLPASWTLAINNLEESDFNATDFLVGRQVLMDIRNTDTFVEYLKVGNTQILDSGFIGVLYGCRVTPVSTNAGMTTTTAYVIDRTQAYCIVEKRPYTLENFNVETHDMSAVTISQRIAVKALRTSAICKITST